jgi:hypothetical protein
MTLFEIFFGKASGIGYEVPTLEIKLLDHVKGTRKCSAAQMCGTDATRVKLDRTAEVM